MADTRIQIEVEDWVRLNWMPQQFGQKFCRERLPLSSGGVFDFDAVSEDRKIVATISTSGAKTVTGKHAVGKLLKIRSEKRLRDVVESFHFFFPRVLLFPSEQTRKKGYQSHW